MVATIPTIRLKSKQHYYCYYPKLIKQRRKTKKSATEAAVHAAIEAENQEEGELEHAVDNPILDTETIVSDQITAQQTPLALKESIKNNPLKLGIFSIRLVNALANSFLGVPSAAVIIAADQIHYAAQPCLRYLHLIKYSLLL